MFTQQALLLLAATIVLVMDLTGFHARIKLGDKSK